MSEVPLVVIIDDHPDMLLSLEALMQNLGYRARLFASADEFFADTGLKDACCIVSDVQMPGVNGFELSRRVTHAARPVPVILISAATDDATKRQAFASGARSFFCKPLDLPAFIEQLASIVREGGTDPSPL